jgi:hypothetical protein
MSGGKNGPPIRYRVGVSQKLQHVIKELSQRAKNAGTLDKFSTALTFIFWRLQTDPLVFGEPTHHLAHLSLVIRTGAAQPVVVHYGVHVEKQFVILQNIVLISS